MEPSPELPGRSVSNGRSATGQFLLGNAGGPGNPHGGKVSRLRSALLNAITEEDIVAVIAALLERAKAGDVQSAKLLLDRTIGKPNSTICSRVRPGRTGPEAGSPVDITPDNLPLVKQAILARIARLAERGFVVEPCTTDA